MKVMFGLVVCLSVMVLPSVASAQNWRFGMSTGQQYSQTPRFYNSAPSQWYNGGFCNKPSASGPGGYGQLRRQCTVQWGRNTCGPWMCL